MTTSRFKSTLFVLAIAFVSPAPGQILFQTVAATGDPAPGFGPDYTIGPFVGFTHTFSSISINQTGQVAFGSGLVGPGVTSANSTVVWSNVPGSLSSVLRTEVSQYPGPPPFTFGGIVQPKLADTGAITFCGHSGGGVLNGGQYRVSLSGEIIRLAHANLPVPPGQGDLFWASPCDGGHPAIPGPAMNSAGRIAFYGQVRNSGGVPTGFRRSIWAEDETGLKSIAVGNTAIAPGTTDTFALFGIMTSVGLEGIWPAFNDSSQVAFYATLNGAAAPASRGIWTTTAGPLGMVARGGDLAFGTSAQFFDFGNPVINNAGQMVFRGSLIGAGVTPDSDTGLWAGTAGNMNLLALEGAPAPQLAGVNYGEISHSPIINGPGDILFKSLLTGSSVTSDNDNALWMYTSGATNLIAREGETAPGLPGDLMLAGAPRFTLMNTQGQVAFLMNVTGSGVTTENDQVLWAADRLGNLTPVLREGDLFEVRPGVFKQLTEFLGLVDGGGQEGRVRNFNDQGELVVLARFTDGTQSVVVATIPEPASLVLLAAAIGLFAIRRR